MRLGGNKKIPAVVVRRVAFSKPLWYAVLTLNDNTFKVACLSRLVEGGSSIFRVLRGDNFLIYYICR